MAHSERRKIHEECGREVAHTLDGRPYTHKCVRAEAGPEGFEDPTPWGTSTFPVTDGMADSDKQNYDVEKGPWFGAMYDGHCDGCGDDIFEGDRIRADGAGGYECENCGHDDLSNVAPETQTYQAQASAAAKRHLEAELANKLEEAAVQVEAMSPVSVAAMYSDPTSEAITDAMPFEDPTPAGTDVLNVSGQPKARYQWRGSQNMGYLVKDPATGDFRRYKNGSAMGWTRATTFNKAASSTTALTAWSKRNVVIGATRRPDALLRAHGLTHADRQDLDQVVADLEEAAGAKVGADIGTYLHSFTEQMDAGNKTWRDAPPQYQDQLRRYAQMLENHGLEPVPGMIERTTCIREFGGVVGTFDRVYYDRPGNRYVIGDLKTGKTMDYARDETFCQEWIYAHGVNQNGVYDWNTDAWRHLSHDVGVPNTMPPLLEVSETVGVIIHMPVQGDDAGSLFLEEADLVKGAQYAQLCYDVRSNVKPKRKLWTPPVARDWDAEFAAVTNASEAGALWGQAAGVVSAAELQRLTDIAHKALSARG